MVLRLEYLLILVETPRFLEEAVVVVVVVVVVPEDAEEEEEEESETILATFLSINLNSASSKRGLLDTVKFPSSVLRITSVKHRSWSLDASLSSERAERGVSL